MGCQGFLAKRELLKANYRPRFFHMDAVLELVKKNYNLFAFPKLTIKHQYVDSFRDYYKKIDKYVTNFLRFRKIRTYTYQTSNSCRLWALFLMMTGVEPLLQSLKGFAKIKDPAWFLHPLFCFTVPLISAWVFLKWKIRGSKEARV